MNIPKDFWTALKGLIGILIIFIIILGIGAIKVMSNIGTNRNNVSTISVDGTGDAVSIPDVGTFSFSVTDTEKTVVDAQTKATDKVNAALKAIRAQGVADKDISTQSYNVNPHYEYRTAICPQIKTVQPMSIDSVSSPIYCPGGKNVLTGYDVSETIQIKVRDLAKAGTIFASIGTLGVENVNGLDFSVDDPSKVQAEARGKAIVDAKAKAEVLAKQLGVHLVGVVSFSENSGGYPRPVMYSAVGKGVALDSAAPVAPEIPVGEQKVTSTVSVTYEIK